MFSHVTCILLVAGIGFANGVIREVTVSQANFASLAVDLVTKTYDALLAEGKALEPEIEKCHSLFQQKNSSCMTCLNTIKNCGSKSNVSPLVVILGTMKDPKTLLPLVANGFKSLGEKIASGAETLYKKYGAGPVKVLKTGFNKIGGAFKDLGVAFKQGFVVAFDKLKSAFSAVGKFGEKVGLKIKGWAEDFVDLFGKRRKREYRLFTALDVHADEQAVTLEELKVRQKRADDLSPEAKQCVEKQCPDCSPFIRATTQLDAWRTICGADVIDKNVALSEKAEKVKQFYNDLTEATQDVLKQVMVDTSTGNVVKLVALKGTSYVTYQPTGIAFDPWNHDPAYKAITEFLLSTY